MEGLCLFFLPWWDQEGWAVQHPERERVESPRLLFSLERWWLKHCSVERCSAVFIQREVETLGSIFYSTTLTFHHAYCRWAMGRVLGLEPGDPRVTICVTFTNLCNPSELQFPHPWNADDTYGFGRRFSEIMCVGCYVYVVDTKIFLCPNDTTLYDPHDHHFIPALNRQCILKLFSKPEMMIENLLTCYFSHFLM